MSNDTSPFFFWLRLFLLWYFTVGFMIWNLGMYELIESDEEIDGFPVGSLGNFVMILAIATLSSVLWPITLLEKCGVFGSDEDADDSA